jgi:hypothetical protein
MSEGEEKLGMITTLFKNRIKPNPNFISLMA